LLSNFYCSHNNNITHHRNQKKALVVDVVD
jgi:hypothetical protein